MDCFAALAMTAFPAQWLYGLYVVVLVTGFLATIAFGKLSLPPT
jgi:hypothetical protein